MIRQLAALLYMTVAKNQIRRSLLCRRGRVCATFARLEHARVKQVKEPFENGVPNIGWRSRTCIPLMMVKRLNGKGSGSAASPSDDLSPWPRVRPYQGKQFAKLVSVNDDPDASDRIVVGHSWPAPGIK